MRLIPIFTTLLLVLAFQIVSAQSNSKLNLIAQHQLTKVQSEEALIPLLIKGDTEEIEALCALYNGQYKYGYGSVQSVAIPKKNIEAFASHSAVLRIQGPGLGGQALMDTALIVNNVNPVHAGSSPLPDGYTGEGVIVGIIDDGIYFDHPDLQNPDGSTRIRYIWDQNVSFPFNPPAPYGFGEEWNWIDIDNGSCTHTEQGFSGHGTNVTGIAASDGSAVDDYKGVAPDADIIVVSIGYGSNFLANVADAVDYIFKKADALGKPCVINTSIGTYYGSRDGNDLTTEIIENLLEERPGRSLIAAGGNAGHIDYHLGYDISETDTQFTWFKYNSSLSAIYFDFWADTADLNRAHFAIGADDPGTFTKLGSTAYINIPQTFGSIAAGGEFINRNIFDGSSSLLGQATIMVEQIENSYHVEVQIVPTNTSHWWSLSTTGEGRFDCWAHSGLIGTSSIAVASELPPVSLYPSIVNYQLPDNDKTIVSSWQCSDKVVTVGNFSNRAYYIDYDSLPFNTGETPGDIFYTSSLGPTRDGRIKPDISATGSTTIATGNLTVVSNLISTSQQFKVGFGGMHSRNGGTSMASPIVTGVAALYLEMHPNASWNEIKYVLLNGAKQDLHTGSALPDNTFGYGKVDAFAALQVPVTLGCTDTSAFNYNPSANVNDGSCIPVIYGCMDTAAMNYNAMANTADTCIYKEVGIEWLGEDIQLTAYPNPTNGQVSFYLNLAGVDYQQAELHIQNELGQEVYSTTLSASQQKITYNGQHLSAGLYIYRLEIDGKTAYSNKLIKY